MTEQQKKVAAPAVHYGFGTSVGAIYGMLLESRQVKLAGWGLPFGALVWLAAHVIVVPALDLSEQVTSRRWLRKRLNLVHTWCME